MPHTELLSITRLVCKTINNKTTDRNLACKLARYQTVETAKQTRIWQTKPDEGSASKDKTNMSDCLNFSTSKTIMLDYFNSSDNKETDKRANEVITTRIHNEFNELFSSIGCFEGMFSLQVAECSFPYQTPPRRVVYASQKPMKGELQWHKRQEITVPLGTDKTSQWCNSFVFGIQTNEEVRLCLDTA